MGVCTASGRMGAMFAQIANAKLMMASSNQDSDGDEATQSVASARVLIIASSALLFGALMPMLLGRDVARSELRDEINEPSLSFAGSKIVTCGGFWSANKEHLSDEEADANAVKKDSLQFLEYDSFRHEGVEANQPFLL
jgi:hypothetical protein